MACRRLLQALIIVILSTSCGAVGAQRLAQPAAATVIALPLTTRAADTMALTSTAVSAGGALPARYTCDGVSATLPLAWSAAPAGTQSFAIVMHHIPGPGDSHWYWVLYNIPASVQALAENSSGVGTLGNNSVNGQTAYAPPCSQGPGAKIYTYTVYALSAPPQMTVAPSQVTRDVLLAAIADRTLASATLNVVYTRPALTSE